MCVLCETENVHLGEPAPGVHLGRTTKAWRDYEVGEYTLTFHDTPFLKWARQPTPDPYHGLDDATLDALSAEEWDTQKAWLNQALEFSDGVKLHPQEGWRLVDACLKAGYVQSCDREVLLWLWHKMGKELE